MKYEVEVTKTETRTYKAKVAVESDLPHDVNDPEELGDELEDDIREKAEEIAWQLDDEEWEDISDPRGASPSVDVGEIEGFEDVA
jgi:hypothetical protein